MKADTREWVRYAEEDFRVATALMRQRKMFPANSVGFHCQQCVEKYFKARLVEAGKPIPKTHDLEGLLQLLLPNEPLWAAFQPVLGTLTSYAAQFRYPGHAATKQDAKEALRDCRAIRKEVRACLGLPAR